MDELLKELACFGCPGNNIVLGNIHESEKEMCKNIECPYYRLDEDCPADKRCSGYIE